jgi:serine/threonine protein phosphatase PrpC
MDKNNVIEQYKEISKTYSSFEDCYKLVVETNNVEICTFCLDSDGIWKRLELKWMLEFFQNNEDYEKCGVLKKLIDEHFIADESKQNELNKKLDEYVSYINNGGE